MVRFMDRCGIERALVSSSQAILYDFRAGNREVAEAVANSDRLLGLVVLNPNYPEASIREMHQYLGREGFVGLKLYGYGYIGRPIDCEEHHRFLRVLEGEYPGRLVLFHCGRALSLHSEIAAIAQEFPETAIIMGHMGDINWQLAIPRVKGVGNIYLEVSSASQERGRTEWAVEQVGEERVLFGSDFTLFNPAYTMGAILDADLPERVKRKILYENAARLLKL
jgi:hypothetical protein